MRQKELVRELRLQTNRVTNLRFKMQLGSPNNKQMFVHTFFLVSVLWWQLIFLGSSWTSHGTLQNTSEFYRQEKRTGLEVSCTDKSFPKPDTRPKANVCYFDEESGLADSHFHAGYLSRVW